MGEPDERDVRVNRQLPACVLLGQLPGDTHESHSRWAEVGGPWVSRHWMLRLQQKAVQPLLQPSVSSETRPSRDAASSADLATEDAPASYRDSWPVRILLPPQALTQGILGPGRGESQPCRGGRLGQPSYRDSRSLRPVRPHAWTGSFPVVPQGCRCPRHSSEQK